MPRDGSLTRERIMDAAQELILERGYSATSVDQLIERAAVTKGTFFYHFRTKQALAKALAMRWGETDLRHLDHTLDRAKKLAGDPVQQLLLFVGLFEELFERAGDQQPGCLYASFSYDTELGNADIAAIVRDGFDNWRERLGGLVSSALASSPPQAPASSVELTDMLSAIIEGGIVLSRVYGDPGLVAAQLRQYRNYLALLFCTAETTSA